jgi:carbon monoxide dehydrogenase subunit G
MRIEQEFAVAAPAERVWDFLMDVPTMAECIPGAADVEQIDDRTFNATVTAKIGPVTARFGCTIVILAVDVVAHTGTIEVSGRDTKIGGGVSAKTTMVLTEADGQTLVRLASDVDILGKIGQYGHGMVSKRANTMLDEFAACARARLAG